MIAVFGGVIGPLIQVFPGRNAGTRIAAFAIHALQLRRVAERAGSVGAVVIHHATERMPGQIILARRVPQIGDALIGQRKIFCLFGLAHDRMVMDRRGVRLAAAWRGAGFHLVSSLVCRRLPFRNATGRKIEAPIGSIIAYAGEVTHAWEDQNGWLRCDGRLLDNTQADNAALFKAIGFAWGGDNDTKFNVPDLQGLFLRGVDPVRPPPQDRPGDTHVPFPADPDRDQRFPIRLGGNSGNKVGSAQLYGTALPTDYNKPFITETGGGHNHRMNFEIYASRDVDSQYNTVAYPSRTQDFTQWPHTELSGEHYHHIRHGGDSETRPLNAYVHWIIRYK